MDHTWLLPLEFDMTGTVFAVALNHKSQLEFWNDAFHQDPYKTPPKTPVWFIKPRNTIVGNGDNIVHPGDADVLSGGTLGMVIGRRATRVSAAEARGYIKGFCAANEVSHPETTFYRPAIRAKCRDTFCPLGAPGPLSAVDQTEVVTLINGRQVNSWSTRELVRNAAQILEALTEFATLEEGDVILMGTPQERVAINVGDEVEIRVQGLPELRNKVVAS